MLEKQEDKSLIKQEIKDAWDVIAETLKDMAEERMRQFVKENYEGEIAMQAQVFTVLRKQFVNKFDYVFDGEDSYQCGSCFRVLGKGVEK